MVDGCTSRLGIWTRVFVHAWDPFLPNPTIQAGAAQLANLANMTSKTTGFMDDCGWYMLIYRTS